MRSSDQRINQQGMTLVELLIALALSVILMNALVEVISSNAQNNEVAINYSKIQDSSRMMNELLRRDLKGTGSFGCLPKSDDPNKAFSVPVRSHLNGAAGSGFKALIHPNTGDINQMPFLRVIDNFTPAGGGTIQLLDNTPGTIAGLKPRVGSDVLVTIRTLTSYMFLRSPKTADPTRVEIRGTEEQISALKPGVVTLLTDCAHGEIIAISDINVNASGTAGILHADFNYSSNTGPNGPNNVPPTNGQFKANSGAQPYDAGSFVYIFNPVILFVAESQSLSKPHAKVYSLYRYSSYYDQAFEMVPYVDDMQLLFGLDTDKASDGQKYMIERYITASDPLFNVGTSNSIMRDVSSASSINIELTMVSPTKTNSLPPKDFSPQYDLNNDEKIDALDVAAAQEANYDGRLRKRYNQLIYLPNLVPATF